MLLAEHYQGVPVGVRLVPALLEESSSLRRLADASAMAVGDPVGLSALTFAAAWLREQLDMPGDLAG